MIDANPQRRHKLHTSWREPRVQAMLISAVAAAVCLALVLLNLQQRSALERIAAGTSRFRQARLDLARGFAHVVASDAEDSPFDRNSGFALMLQATREFEEELSTGTWTQPLAGVAPFRALLHELYLRLSEWSRRPRLEPDETVELRLSIHQAETQAYRLAEEMRDSVMALRREQDFFFAFVMTVAAGLVSGVYGLVYAAARRAAAAEAREREVGDLLRALADSTTDAIFAKDLQGRYQFVNAAAARFMGKSVDEILGRDESAVFDAESARLIQVVDGKVIAGGETLTNEESLTASEVTRTYLATKSPLRDSRGEVTGVIGISRDITDRKQAENEAREQQRLISSIAAASPLTIYVFDLERRELTYCNDHVLHELGYSGAGVSARDWSWISSLLHPEDLDRLLPLFDVWDTAQDGQIFETSYRLQHADGSWRWFVSRDTPFQRNAAGRITQIVGTIEDITVRLRALEQLQESEHKFRQLADAIPHIVWICRVDGAMTHINARATEYTGLHVHDLIGWKWGNALHPADREETLRRWTDILQSGVPSDLEFRLRAADGGYRWHVGRQVPIRNEQGGITQWFGTCSDIEDQKRAHAMLAGNNRVLAQIAAGVSLPEILDELVRFIEELLGDSRCSILLLDADGQHLRLGAAPNLPPAYNRAIDGVEIGPTVGSCGTAAYLRETVVVGDIADDERWEAFRELAAEHGLVACWSVPILAREAEANSEVLGTFAVYPRGIGVPGPAEFAVIRRAADLARVAIERDRTIRAMRESEAKFRTLADYFPDSIFVIDPDSRGVPMRILYVNPAIRQTHGYEPGEVVGQSLVEFLDARISAERAAERTARLMAGEKLTFEVVHRHCSGRDIPMEVRAGLIPWDGRNVILGINRDLTLWKQAQEQLKLLEISIARINDVVMITNANYEIIYVNDAFERLTRHRRADVLNRRPSFLHGPRTDREELTRIDQALQRNEPVRAELYNYKQDGTEFLLEMEVVPILDHDGRATHYAAVERDITERRRAEAELRDSEERLRVALTAAGSVAFVWDTDSDSVTRYFSSELALPANIHTRETIADVIARVHPDDVAAFQAGVDACLASGNIYRNLYRIVRPDGTHCWLEEYGSLTRDALGRPLRLTGISIDVTERKRADEERDRLWNEALDPVCIAGFDGRFKQVNPAWERLLGWPTETLTERAWMDFVHPDDHAATEQALERLRNGQSLTGFENRYRCRDGSYRNFLWNASTLPEWRTIFGIVRDVTEHKQLEAQLRQSQKMEAIGQLAGGIAHDFNNIITVISGYGSLLQTQIPPEHAAQLGVREVLKAAQSATDLVKKLLAFSRKQSWQLTVIDLHELLVNAESWVRRLLGDGIVLQSRLHARAANVLADRGQLEQVLLNLALNARDAMNGQGELSVETADDTLVLAGDDSDHREVPAVRLTVRDTGAGIDPAILPKIFDPFVTTKPVGQGTGLGLSTVYGFVRQCRGTVTAESEPGCGAAFIIRLPTVDGQPDPAAAATSPRPAEAAARPSGTILLVEDFEPLRTLTANVLRNCGYLVYAAADGVEALERYAEHADEIDLLVTDVMMPRMSGADLAIEIRRRQPRARILFLSGYAEGVQQRAGLDSGDSWYLQKPYAPDEFLETVRRLLKADERSAP